MLERYYHKTMVEAGCDEAGRGCLAGPVFAAAVILPKKFSHPDLNDSKQLNEATRNKLRRIIEKKAICWAVASVDNVEIDRINILNASFLAMHRALDQLPIIPQMLLIDGNRFTQYREIKHECIIQGDGKYMSIAAASILAKTYRDEYMQKLDKDHPHYGWCQNKGYPTRTHREAIETFGCTPFHRMSFQLLPEQIELELV
jgi:ribonuclease HII